MFSPVRTHNYWTTQYSRFTQPLVRWYDHDGQDDNYEGQLRGGRWVFFEIGVGREELGRVERGSRDTKRVKRGETEQRQRG